MENEKFKKEYSQYLNSTKTPSEDILEKAVIHFLINENKFKYRDDIKYSDELKENFRYHFQRLNKLELEDNDFEKWWINFNSGDIIKRFQTLKSDPYQYKDKNGKVVKTLKYFDFENIDNNSFEIINQLWTRNKNNGINRFDILLMINNIESFYKYAKKHYNFFKIKFQETLFVDPSSIDELDTLEDVEEDFNYHFKDNKYKLKLAFFDENIR